MTTTKSCTNNTPPSFVGHWKEWHRGHGCDKDDGKPRSEDAKTEIAQIDANAATGSIYLTDAELRLLRARTTSGDDLLVRALDELRSRRGAPHESGAYLTEEEVRFLRRRAWSRDDLLVRAIDELVDRRRRTA